MAANGGRTGSRYARMRSHVIATETVCVFCGLPVDKTLSGNHRLGPTVEHLDKIDAGGSVLPPRDRWRLAHKSCNSSDGAKYLAAKRARGGGRPASRRL